MASKKRPGMLPQPPVSSSNKTLGGRFPIVALGASAGGVEAFEAFFRNAPVDSGMAFVLIAHLAPNRASLLTDILQRQTSMEVVEASDRMPLMPDRIHVIPPNREMAVINATLQLAMPDQPRGKRMPIDHFLLSLAKDQGDQAIGVILSGTGTDGTFGLKAIHDAGGICLVQEPATAKHGSMPASAIEAGCASSVLLVEAMPGQLVEYLRSRPDGPEGRLLSTLSPESVERILTLVRSGSGHDFSHYKQSTISRRIERRMAALDIDNPHVYVEYVDGHPEEVPRLVKEFLINVTSFFRDPEAFAALADRVLPTLLADKPERGTFRIWVVGCATGEEAYSIAMLLHEYMIRTRAPLRVQIYSTDLDEDAIDVARAGLYAPTIAQDISPERLSRFFTEEESGYRVIKDIREMVVFAAHNVIKDPPFTRLDLVCCRNLLIYLQPNLQDRIISVFHYALNPGGVLFLSHSESIGRHADLFSPVDRKWKIYRSVGPGTPAREVMESGLYRNVETGRGIKEDGKKRKNGNIAEFATRELLDAFVPAAVVTDLRGNILYVHGDTSAYLGPAPGPATLNVVEMARECLRGAVRTALQSMGRREELGHSQPLAIRCNDVRRDRTVELGVRPLVCPETSRKLLLLRFQDVEPSLSAGPGQHTMSLEDLQQVEELEKELRSTREDLQAIIEEEQASNEELHSTNEELQSTNEALETSKEELQSLNEELVTVNSELHSKVEQLTDMQNDMKNLLDNINVGTILLDEDLSIRRFTRQAVRIFHLVETDVGRPLDNIKSEIEGTDILVVAKAVLDSHQLYEYEVRTTDGAWYLACITPYRTLENNVTGVMLAFFDISQRIAAEVAIREAREFAESIVNSVREPLVVLDGQYKVVSASRSFYRYFRNSPVDVIDRPFFTLGDGQWENAQLRAALEPVLRRNANFDGLEIEQAFPGIGRKRLLLNARRIIRSAGEPPLILLAFEDVTGKIGLS